MDKENVIRRSKIYTYFYGRNTVFQQFLIIAGVLFLLLAGVASSANAENYRDKLEDLREDYYDASEDYDELYYEYSWYFDIDRGEEVEVSRGDDYYDEKRDYNDALEDYLDAKEKFENYREKGGSKSFFGTLCKILGILCIAGALIWMLIKKLTFNRDGEKDYDEELQHLVEEAKKKGLDKLNIVSDQIERVEPVVLHGVAHSDEVSVSLGKSPLMNAFSRLGRIMFKFGKIILGVILAVVFTALAGAISKNMVLFAIVFFVALFGLGGCGYLVYKKFELESYVSPKTIKKLEMFPPHFMSKLGSDDGVRVSLPAITVYMFGDDQLYVYYQYLDIVTGKIFCEGVNEYFYEDIVGITSSQETKKMFKRCGFLKLSLKSIEYLKESITVVSSGCMHKEAYIVDVGKSLLDTSFIGMRNLIRQKKAE